MWRPQIGFLSLGTEINLKYVHVRLQIITNDSTTVKKGFLVSQIRNQVALIN